MKKILMLALVVAGAWDLKTLPNLAAFQSITTAEQEIGFAKPVWHLEASGQALLNLGLFAGAEANDAGKPVFGRNSMNLGPTAQVPGSSLDWLLGTKMGSAWLPKLKTGVYAGYDLLAPSSIKLKPNFIGFGIAYPVFGSS